MFKKSFLAFLMGGVLLGVIGCSGGSVPGAWTDNGKKQDIMLADKPSNGTDGSNPEILLPDSYNQDSLGDQEVTRNWDTEILNYDTEEADAKHCPGMAGCECMDDSQCYSEFCIETSTGHQCAQFCDSDSSCPQGFDCVSVASNSGEMTRICVYKYPSLCLPCQTNDDCKTKYTPEGTLCVAWASDPDNAGGMLSTYGSAGAFCGAPCQEDTDCPDGYFCDDVVTTAGNQAKQCVMKTDECGCTDKAKANQAQGKCYQKNEFGTCEGTFQCTDQGKTDCTAKEPAAETCNHEDDNCDGQTDEGFDTQTDVNNCGDCGIKCENPHGTTSCVDGVCKPECDDGFADCNDDVKDGCETDLSQVDSCGRCQTSDDCPGGFFCKDGNCIKKYPAGHDCIDDSDCADGICTDEKVCCDQACDGPCQSCKTGSCVPIDKDAMPETQDGCNGFLCDGSGQCLATCESPDDCLDSYFCESTQGDPDYHLCKPDLDLGGDCKDEGNQACKSRFCADGVCCESACDGKCKACDASGTCNPVLNAEDPDTCHDGSSCNDQGVCKSNNGQQCTGNLSCISGICKDGFCCPTACDGPCMQCTANGCVPVRGQDDVPECTGENTCNADGMCRLKDGAKCEDASDCASGRCIKDYDGTGGWCGEATDCYHNGTKYADGEFSDDCWTGTERARCQNGKWVKESCGSNTCEGQCGTGENSCSFHVMTCENGTCTDTPTDPDTQEKYCKSCGLKWAIGGNTAAANCCGDDSDEYVRTCSSQFNDGSCGSDTEACCDSDQACVDHVGHCADSGKCYVFGGAKKAYCDHGTWKDPDVSKQACEAAGCGYRYLSHGIGANSKCCGDDPGEDFNQTRRSNAACCYNGKVLSSGSTDSFDQSILCVDGQLYDCNNKSSNDSGVATTVSTCTQVGKLFCSASGVWKAGKERKCACTTNSQCETGYCKADFDRSGRWCAYSNECAHNGTIFSSGQYASDACFSPSDRAYCDNGRWIAKSCGSNTTCASHYCKSGQCKTSYKGHTTRCNTAWKCTNGVGDNKYGGTSGTYRCQGYCDGSGHCDYAGSCDNCSNNYYHGTGSCSGSSCYLKFCARGYGNCDGNPSNGCETLLNNDAGSCGNAANIGNICADENSTGPSKTGRGNAWVKVYAKECSNSDTDFAFTANLSVPSGVNYDIYLYDSNCSTVLDSSTSAGLGADESVHTTWTDHWWGGHDDSKWLYMHIIYKGGSGCGSWHLSTIGGK